MTAGAKAARVVFSGIQPTGVPQLGNYLGTIKNWVRLQDELDTQRFYSIVDLHALTVPRNPKRLRQETMEMAAALISCGVDPEKSVLFRQSTVPQHSQLHWVLGTITPVGWLNRMTQWKSKLQQQHQNEELPDQQQLNVHSSAAQGLLTGLFTYPVLMASDVLLYKATHIPVGEDQVQHIELARDISIHFNKTFKTRMFPLPEYMLTATKRVMSLRDPQKKMSKSDPNKQSRITLSDSDDEIARKIRKAPTDSIGGISYDPKGRPGVSNLISIYAAVRGVENEDAAKEMQAMSNKEMKEMVAQAVIDEIAPIRQRMTEVLGDQDHLESLLRQGEEKARETADRNWREIARCIGLPY
ncbi:Tryptophan--tRNA ligase, mitochondrial [Coemansia sp. RSA 2607]|nr:Tryptophan--tRNA ligase, mitochondrial [Coemansia sp. RSA 2607]KAJ2385180.1 Tryptophan--tRNA ligase, mitochondrial [Coemansia sp. RSA 2603]